MIDGIKYIKIVKDYYSFLIDEFELLITDEKVRGNAFYDVQYSDEIKTVSVSYENIEDYLQVIVFLLENGELPDYDNKLKTLHLKSLNKRILSKVDKSEIEVNNSYFERFNPENELERNLLKSAKELRLCLKHFDGLDHDDN